jgi:hypothetical protein
MTGIGMRRAWDLNGSHLRELSLYCAAPSLVCCFVELSEVSSMSGKENCQEDRSVGSLTLIQSRLEERTCLALP